MARLTKYEQETIIRTSEMEDYYDIYTFNTTLKRKLNAFAAKYPECCKKDTSSDLFKNAEVFRVDKKRLSLRLNPPQSDCRRKKAAEQVVRNRKGSNQ